MSDDRIKMAHGAGGSLMRHLIGDVFVRGGGDDPDVVGPEAMEDGGAVRVGDRWLVTTADAHVVAPAFFPGGDIGRLAVCGTVNDLAMMGATAPLGLTITVVVEEGYGRDDLRRIQASIDAACAEAGTRVLAGDTKVMGKGEVDGVVLSSAGFGFADRLVRDRGMRAGDRVIITGSIGDHGLAVMSARHDLGLGDQLRSDVAPLNTLVARLTEAVGDDLVGLKDATRGGVSAVLHELADKNGAGVVLDDVALPISDAARAAGELLGVDPLVVANEGKAVVIVRPGAVEAALAALRAHPLGRDAAAIGEVIADHAGRVIVDTGFGRRLLAEPRGEPLPRIC